MRTQPPSLFFLVGCSRSGTTLLQSLLATHPQILSFPETKFFHCLLPSPYERRRYALNLASRRLTSRLEVFFRDELARPELIRRIPKIPLMGYCTHKFIKILTDLAAEQNKNIILEKTPDHIYRIEYIEKFLPDAKFIHLVRNGADVVASLYEVTHRYPQYWAGARDIDVCIQNWIQAIEISQKYMNCPNHTVIRYEKLIESPQKSLENICQFMGINFDQSMIDDYMKAAEKLKSDKQGRSVITQGIHKKKLEKFNRVFDAQQRKYILERLYGYDLTVFDTKKVPDPT